ncbi:MAG: hypothetical protein JWO26_669 [Rhodospirillales bacterium]|jgi:hypothetical protein|nr:hypothetical protein [Rhodospirillales bacterium]
MHEPPDAANLLETARALLLAELLPALPEAQKMNARMIANAMAIAARAARDNSTFPTPPEADLIRAGAYDPGTPGHDAAVAMLMDIARARCAVSSPRALDD